MERFSGQTTVVTGAAGGISSAIIKELLKKNVNVVGLDINVEKLKILLNFFKTVPVNKMERFEGQVAVITGAGGGISSAIVKELLKRNVNVVGLEKNENKIKALEEEVSKNTEFYNGKFYPKICDVTNKEQVSQTFKWVKTNLKTISILVNGAGVNSATDNGIQDITAEDFDKIFNNNVKSVILCAKEAINMMMEDSVTGHIINICSTAGHEKAFHNAFPIYTASKHSVRVFSDALRREMERKRTNIKVTNLSPGNVNTGLWKEGLMSKPTANGEILSPQDFAKACMSILDTPPHLLISDITIQPIYQRGY